MSKNNGRGGRRSVDGEAVVGVKGWVEKRIGDIAKTQYGLSESMNSDGIGYKIFRMGEVQGGRLIDTGQMKCADITEKEFRAYKLELGDVLFNRTNSFELVGKTGIFDLDGDYCFASYLVRLLVNRQVIVPEFLNYVMNSEPFQVSVKQKASKSINQANINATILANERIRFPESLTEQQRIVGILDEAFAGIATAKANTEKSLRNARDLLQPAFGELFATSTSGHSMTVQVEQLAKPLKGSIRTGPFGSQLLHSEFVDSGIAVLGIDNAVQNKFAWSERRYITPAKYKELRRYTVHPGDVIITIMGTCGRCAVIPDDIPVAINSKHLCCITLDQGKCLPSFLHAYFLHHPDVRAFLESRATGSVMDGLNMGIIKQIPVRLPSIASQREIMRKFEAVRLDAARLASLYTQKLTALDALKKSLLHQAFSGQL